MEGTQNKQAGFNIVELLLIIVAVGVIGIGGWFVYQHNRTKVSDAAGSNQTTQQTTSTTPPAPTTSYLDIKEWGIKLPLSSTISDAYYVAGVGSIGTDGVTNQIYLGLKSYDGSGCTAAGSNRGQDSALAMIFRSKPGEVDPVTNQLLTQEYPDGVTLGNYFYAYQGHADTNISTCKAPKADIQAIDSAFAAAAKGIVSDSTN